MLDVVMLDALVMLLLDMLRVLDITIADSEPSFVIEI